MKKTAINEYKALCRAIFIAYEATESSKAENYNLKVWRRIYTFMKAITDAYAYIDTNRAIAEVNGFKVSVEINKNKVNAKNHAIENAIGKLDKADIILQHWTQ